MGNNKTEKILLEVGKVIYGKEDVSKKILMAILANGHILLDDVPGVGKTSIAMAFSRALGLAYHRIQFTPDVMPSDIVGFSMYHSESSTFSYMPGVIADTNLLLADEINRTSSRTQSALLEAMEERQVTVDGVLHPLKKPFLVIATENQVGTAGTQLLPHAQLDRFMVCLCIGYPDLDTQKDIIRGRQGGNPLDEVEQVTDCEGVLKMQEETMAIHMSEEILDYIANLAVNSRQSPYLSLGISPRGAITISHMAKACAYLNGRDYVTDVDVLSVFQDVCAHRVILSQKARSGHMSAKGVLDQIQKETPLPFTKI